MHPENQLILAKPLRLKGEPFLWSNFAKQGAAGRSGKDMAENAIPLSKVGQRPKMI